MASASEKWRCDQSPEVESIAGEDREIGAAGKSLR